MTPIQLGLRVLKYGVAAVFGLAGTVVLLGALLLSTMPDEWAHQRLIKKRVVSIAREQGSNTIALSRISDGDVERVCFGQEYVPMRDLADRYGLSLDVADDLQVPESSYEIFVVGPAGEVTFGALHRNGFSMPTDGAHCWTGTELAFQFDEIDPLTGGQLIDLGAADLEPTLLLD